MEKLESKFESLTQSQIDIGYKNISSHFDALIPAGSILSKEKLRALIDGQKG